MSPLVLSEILGVFVKTLTADSKYPVQDCKNLPLLIQMQLSEKRKTFSKFFLPFPESTSNFKSFKTRTIVIANIFPKLQTVKKFVRNFSKEQRFRTGFGSQHVKSYQMVAKSPSERFYDVFHDSRGSSFGKSEILGVFVNILTADARYPIQDCENWQLPIQMQLSQKRKTFSLFFVPFLESTSNFKGLEKKDDCHR